MSKESYQKLCKLLSEQPEGPLKQSVAGETLSLLTECWDYVNREPHTKTYGYKLDRWESPRWEPPLLRFVLERHGGTVMGSSRAELQHWVVDLDMGRATIEKIGHRQMTATGKRLDCKKLAVECAELVKNRKEHEWLNWKNPEKTKVAIKISGLIPETNLQTTTSRRKRFRNAIRVILNEAGWQETKGTSPNTWELQ